MRGVRASEDCNKSFATRSFTAVEFLKARGQDSSWETAQVPCSPHPTHVPPAPVLGALSTNRFMVCNPFLTTAPHQTVR